MTSMFEHFHPEKGPSCTKTSATFPIAPTMQAIIIDRVPVVNPQLASIIGEKAKSVAARLVSSHATCPTHSKVIASAKSRPSAPSVPVIHSMAPTSHVRSATEQVGATTSLAKVEGILPEDTMAIDW
jgi:hypothetical protein